MAKNLFVGGLPFTIAGEALEQLFGSVGQVQSVNIIKDRYTGNSRGFGFVEMVNDEDAKKAIEKLNGYNLEGRNIVVKEALPKPTYTNGRGSRDRQASFGYRGNRRY
ncbi:MAG: RNP-1 like protein RNA-binding protein [uncultured bacterium]|nr:MAG: RNP-1 like protein RNA-binding protein [uncultured bacterium]